MLNVVAERGCRFIVGGRTIPLAVDPPTVDGASADTGSSVKSSGGSNSVFGTMQSVLRDALIPLPLELQQVPHSTPSPTHPPTHPPTPTHLPTTITTTVTDLSLIISLPSSYYHYRYLATLGPPGTASTVIPAAATTATAAAAAATGYLLPPQSLFTGLSEDEFRVDLSSTDIRSSRKNEA